jgi:hypothetical protein
MAFLTLLIGKFAMWLTANHFAGRHFAKVDSMLRGATWQEDYRPISRLSVASKRH